MPNWVRFTRLKDEPRQQNEFPRLRMVGAGRYDRVRYRLCTACEAVTAFCGQRQTFKRVKLR